MTAAGSFRFDVVVIGAGVSGLVVAHRCARAGARVAVVDAEPRPGGVIETRERDGFLYETAANSALDNATSLNALVDELGIAGERVDARAAASKRYIVRGGRLVALPASPRELVGTRAFGPVAKLRLLREPFVAASPPDVEESVASFARRRLGAEILDYAVDPFVAGIHAGDARELSLRAAFPRVYALEQQHGSLVRGQISAARANRRATGTRPAAPRSFSFRDGMRTLPRALAESAGEMILATRVETLRRSASGFDIAGVRDRGPIALTSRAVVVATPAYGAASLVGALAPQAADALGAIDHAPVAIVASAYRRDDVAHPLDGFGFLAPTKERRRVLGTLFSSSTFEGRAPAGHVLLTIFAGGRRNPELVALDDATLVAAVAAELEALLGARAALWSEVVRWPKAIPQYALGHLERIAAIDAATAAVPGLFVHGSWRDGISVGDRIASGETTAGAVQRFLGSTARAT